MSLACLWRESKGRGVKRISVENLASTLHTCDGPYQRKCSSHGALTQVVCTERCGIPKIASTFTARVCVHVFLLFFVFSVQRERVSYPAFLGWCRQVSVHFFSLCDGRSRVSHQLTPHSVFRVRFVFLALTKTRRKNHPEGAPVQGKALVDEGPVTRLLGGVDRGGRRRCPPGGGVGRDPGGLSGVADRRDRAGHDQHTRRRARGRRSAQRRRAR